MHLVVSCCICCIIKASGDLFSGGQTATSHNVNLHAYPCPSCGASKWGLLSLESCLIAIQVQQSSCVMLCRQGEQGDNFYVIQTGTFKATKMEEGFEKLLFTYHDQGAFGELALMYNCPRAATVTVQSGQQHSPKRDVQHSSPACCMLAARAASLETVNRQPRARKGFPCQES